MVEWEFSNTLITYPDAEKRMADRVDEIILGKAPELIWCLEHPPLYTAGSSAKPADLLDAHRFPVYPSPRGGQYTYHGPGQRVIYAMLDLNKRGRDVRKFVQKLETWVIESIGEFGVRGEIRDCLLYTSPSPRDS